MASVGLRWDSSDRHRVWTYVATAGLLVGAMLAIFGLPPVDLHSPLHRLEIMDPLCGGTRALRYTMLTEWRLAWTYNPLSPVLGVGAVLALMRHLVGALSGRWLTIEWRWSKPLLVVLALAVIALEVNQQLHASLLAS
ncbi:DUF2752 domain-containing protein [Nonomuraea sp. NBC_00507]|uniref:DUF2752 domain-containing protein n=1 Tax=Nonomuraea sp. NBC_00507 TaxID=2976002 RepID=UPI002E18BAA5